jgi:hypothetical protein
VPQPKDFELFTPEQKGIIAHLDQNGIVTFAVSAGPESSLRGTEMFNRMVDAFSDEISAIQGVWVKGPQGDPSINIDKVNELTAQGVPLEKAVLEAWTVTRARKRGFATVVILSAKQESGGSYSKIEVLITK